MKKFFLFILILFSINGFGQLVQFPTGRGLGYPVIIADTSLGIPSDTIRPTSQIISRTLIARKGTSIYYWNGSYWAAVSGGGSGNTNTSIGTGFKVAVNGTNNIKSLTAGGDIILDSSTAGQLRISYFNAFPNWQQTLDEGTDMDKDNTIAGNGFSFTFGGFNDFDITTTGSQTFGATSLGVKAELGITNGYSVTLDARRVGFATDGSALEVFKDSIAFTPREGNMGIDSLDRVTDTTGYDIMGWKRTGGGKWVRMPSTIVGATPTWQSTLLASGGSTLQAGGNSINGSGGAITWTNFDEFNIAAAGNSTISGGSMTFTSNVNLNGSSFGSGFVSSNNAIDSMVVINKSTNQIGYRPIPSGSSGITNGTTTITSGTDTYGLFQDGSVVGEDAGFTYNKTTDALTITALVTSGGFSPTATTATGNRLYLPASNTLGLAINGTGEVQLTASALAPITNGGNDLGTTSLLWGNSYVSGTGQFGSGGRIMNFQDQSGAIGEIPAGRIMITNSSANLNIYPSGDAGTSGVKVGMYGYTGSAWKSVLEYANGASLDLYLNKSGFGKVGIATSTPTQALTVNGQIRITAINSASTFDSILVINDGIPEAKLASALTGLPYIPLSGTGTLTGGATIEQGANPFTLNSSAAANFTINGATVAQLSLNGAGGTAILGSDYKGSGMFGLYEGSGDGIIADFDNNTSNYRYGDGAIVVNAATVTIANLAGTGTRVTTATSAGLMGSITNGSNGDVLTLVAGVPAWQAGSGGGANTALSNLTSVAINTSLLPGTDNAIDLGSAAKQWRDLYMTGASIYMNGVKTLSSAGLDLPTGGALRSRTSAGNTVKVQGYDVDGTAYVDVLTVTSNNTVTADLNSIVTIGGNPIATTTGSVATLTTPRDLYGFSFNGSAGTVSGTNIIASGYGGTGNGFTKFSGPATSERTFTLPNASATILTDNAVVTVAQGGIGVGTLTGIVKGNGTSAFSAATANTDYKVAGTLISPSQITGDQDNYTPTGWDDAGTIRISGDATIRAVTSLVAPTAATKPQEKVIMNIGANPIYFPMEHPDGTAANRFTGTEDFILHPYKNCTVSYDATSSRWRIISNDVPILSNSLFYTWNAGSVTSGDEGSMTFLTIGTGTNTATAATTTLPASMLYSTAASATAGFMGYFSKSVVTYSAFATGHNWAEAVVSLPALSDGTETFFAYLQLTATPSSTTAEVNNSCGIRYNQAVNSGKWQLYTQDNAGAESTADLGITVAANTLYKLRIEIDKAKTEVRAYINDQYAGRVTGNMPNSVVIGSRTLLVKTAGTTARTMAVHSQSAGAIHTY